jgi:hypothetical protein
MNQLSFAARNRLRWQRSGFRERPEDKSALFKTFDNPSAMAAREAALLERYDLTAFKAASSRYRYLETLTLLEHLPVLAGEHPIGQPEAPGTPVRWLDVGAKNWSYVQALDSFLNGYTDDYRLEGIELDGYRMYWNLHSRADVAMAYCAALPRATYRVGDVMDVSETYDVVSCFLPFVFLEPAMAWGLPRTVFQPQTFLVHLIQRVRPGGLLILTNQGPEEAEEQGRLFEAVTPLLAETGRLLTVTPLGAMPESFWRYRYPRMGWRCEVRAS